MIRRLLIAFLSFSLFASCNRSRDDVPSTRVAVKDDLGNEVTLQGFPRRIVSLAPSLTEVLFALSLDSQVAGVTEYCDYPPAARNVAKIGGMANPNFERIVELDPDLVLMTVSGNSRADYEKLRSLGITVFVSNPQSVDGVFKSIRDVGTLTQRSDKADSLVSVLRSQQSYLVEQARRERPKTVLLLLSLQPVIAAGPGTFLDELLRLANGINAAANAPTAYPLLSREEIFALQPDVLVVSSDVGRSLDEVIHAYPEWESLKAVRTLRVSIVDASLISRPGPRIMQGLQALLLALHP